MVQSPKCRVEQAIAQDKAEGQKAGIPTSKGEFCEAGELAANNACTPPLHLDERE